MIKVTELQIGDWVCTEHDSTPRQIDWIRTGEVGLLWNKVVTPPYLVPIPLTAEILEKNGFNDDGESVYGDDDSYFIPTYQSGFDTEAYETHIEPNEGIGDFSGRLRYVHELQHALKLCGIKKEIII